MKTKAKEQDSFMQKMFPQRLNTPCSHTTVVKVPGLDLHFSLMMVALMIPNSDGLQSVKRIRDVASENRNRSHTE